MYAYLLTYPCVCIQKCITCHWKDAQETRNKLQTNNKLVFHSIFSNTILFFKPCLMVFEKNLHYCEKWPC